MSVLGVEKGVAILHFEGCQSKQLKKNKTKSHKGGTVNRGDFEQWGDFKQFRVTLISVLLMSSLTLFIKSD